MESFAILVQETDGDGDVVKQAELVVKAESSEAAAKLVTTSPSHWDTVLSVVQL